ncbi:hypothetical protein FZ983_33505 [Azospirillum sp. B21]|uniref:hypothetical protein n=1 Tax=Azospirillum sp. B21 TaxID=2607496 RepID=UPI0011ED1576|nr:hypothetical protein [Azospirillum sp. B21]KAA0571307.1 hypothetical protein FZ983_33505 [Azospirillum sp. B21]
MIDRSRLKTAAQGAGLALCLVLYLSMQDYSEIDFFRDTDDHLRVAWLTWNLSQGHFLPQPLFPRDGGLDGLLVHWTLPWNLFLTGMLALPAWLVGWPEAFRLAAPLIGPALLGAVGTAASWTVAPLVNRQGRIVAAAVAASSPVVLGYGLPGGLDHHLAGIALAMAGAGAAVRGLQNHSSAWAACCGMALAAAVWTAADALPLCLVVAGVLLLTEKGTGQSNVSAIAAAAALVVSCVAVAVDPPATGTFTIDAYRMSVFHASVWLVFFGAAASADAMRGRVNPLLVATVVGIAGAVGWGAILHSGLAAIIVVDFPADMLNRIAEMRPIDTMDRALRVLLPLIPPICVALWTARYTRAPRARWAWAATALGLLALAGLSVWHVRFGAHAQAAAGAVMGVAYLKLQLLARAWRRQAVSSTSATLVRSAPSLSVAVIAMAHVVPMVPSWPPPVAAEGTPEAQGDCVLSRVANSINAALPAGTTVLTDINMAPRLLTLTMMRSFAGPYHGYRGRTPEKLLEILGTADEGEAQLMLRREAVGAVLVCPKIIRSMPRVKDGTFGAVLSSGSVPAWLQPIDLAVSGTALRLYSVR